MESIRTSVECNTERAKGLYIAASCVFMSLYFFRDVFGVGISFYIIYAVAAFIMLFLNENEMIAFIVSITAFANGGFNGMFATIMFGCVMLKSYKYLNNLKIATFLPLIIMCIIETVHYISNGKIVGGVWLTYVLFLLSLAMILQHPDNKINKKNIINSFISFSLFYALIAIVQMTQQMGSLSAIMEIGMRTEEYKELSKSASNLAGNLNFLSSLCSINIGLCIVMLYNVRRKVAYFFAMSLFVLVGLLTVSKMFMVILLIVTLGIIYQSGKRNALYTIVAGCGVVVAATVIVKFFGNTLIKAVVDRFAEGDITTGRLDIIDMLVKHMNENPVTYLWGMGLLNIESILGKAVHSAIYEVLGGWGIIGIILCMVYIYVLISSAKRNAKAVDKKINGINYLPLIVLLLYSAGGMLFSSGLAVIKLMVCIYALEIEEDENVIQHNNTGI